MLVSAARPALAHTTGSSGGFTSGLAHPVSGIDHIAAMIAVGIWGAQLGRPALWVLPVTFPVIMAVGAFLGLVGLPLPGVEIGIAVSGIVLGALVAAEATPRLWVSMALVAAFAVFHGHVHGTELPENQDGVLYSMGFVCSTGLLHATGILIGYVHRWRAGAFVLRALGAMICAVGVYFLVQALR
jgi:urease accessory protein